MLMLMVLVWLCGSAMAATWTHQTTGSYEYWYRDGLNKFRFDNTKGQWWHYGALASWQMLSGTGLTYTGNIGDGWWHNLGTGFTYRYYDVYDDGYFKEGTAYRFRYRYASGQWLHSGDTLSWRYLGSSGLSGTFVGSGYLCHLGNGFTYKYYAPYHDGYFKEGDSYRFRYGYTSGQWYHSGDTLSWRLLGSSGLSAAFLGSGHLSDLGNGFSYWYYARYHDGYFKEGDSYRFRYRYAPGQWLHSGDTQSWQVLSVAGQSSAFVGNGNWHSLGNGFNYRYYAPQNVGYFRQGYTYRFRYRYGPGEWQHTGDSLSWRNLGGIGQTARFMGDESWHSLGNGMSYRFEPGGYSAGYFKDGANYRFMYQYGPGQWFVTGNTVAWNRIGVAGLSASFLGDGAYHDLGNSFGYSYSRLAQNGIYEAARIDRFLYDYTAGQWSHMGPTGGWVTLTSTGHGSSFIGDGAQHNLGNGFLYSYLNGEGYWNLGTASRFKYDYAAGQWNHVGGIGGWTTLGSAGWNAAFVGDGNSYDLGNGFTYAYVLGTDTGSFFQGGLTERFRYLYGTGGWSHYGQFGGWQSLASGMASQFIGDGGSYSLGNGYTYSYNSLTNTGSWLSQALGFTKFAYDYAGGQWYDFDRFANQHSLGSAGNSVAEFMGDGATHVLDATWSYLFNGTTGNWLTGGSSRFQYAYDTGQWSHNGPVGGAFALSAAGRTGQFIGTYTGLTPVDLANGFSYWYDAATGIGHWLVAGASQFDYDYTAGRWSHHGPVGGAFALSAAGANAGFVGDGSARDLGNGFFYSYLAGQGTWTKGAASRFLYDYATAQWSHTGAVGSWVALGPGGGSASFIGEGSHDLGNGFTYVYNALGEFASYLQGGTTERFRYAYNTGDWMHYDWSNAPWLLASGRSADFVGTSDPAGIDLGNGFSYRYGGNVGYWKVGGADRFNYNYLTGLWSHSGFGGGATALTAAGTSGQFVGDGHTLPFDTSYSYWYEQATGRGHWVLTGSAAETFGYDYGTGQWNDYIASRGWRTLGAAGQPLSFIGDGVAHNLGGGVQYTYDLGAGLAYYYFDQNHQFRQSYATGTMEYLHDTNVWSTWSANTAPPGTFAGVGAAPSSSAYMGIAGGSAWFIASNALYSWDGNAFAALAPSGTFTYLSALGKAGTNQYFLGYGGTSGTGYDLFSYDGTTFQEISGNKNYGTTTWIGAIGDVPYFKINGGTGHTGWDLFNWSTGTFSNLSNRGFTTLDLLATVGSEFFFNGNSAAYPSYSFGLYSWNGTWNQRSTTTYSGPITYLTTTPPGEMLFHISGYQYGFPVGPYNLYGWNGTAWNQRTTNNFSALTYMNTIGNVAYFKASGGTGHTGWDLYSWDGAMFNTLSNWNFSVVNLNGALGNNVWVLGFGGTNPATLTAHTNNDLFVWDGAAFVQASNMGFSSPFSHLATVGDNAFFSFYGGTSHTGYDLFVLNGTTVTQASTLGVAPTYLASLGTTDAFFRFTGGTGHTGTDVFRWSGGSLTNISNIGATSMAYLTTLLGSDLYFSVNGGTGHTGYDVFRWNGSAGWANVSNVGASALTQLATLGPDLYFSVMGGSTGTGYDLYKWDGLAFTDVSGNSNFSTLSLFAQDGNTGFFLGISGTDRSLYRWNGSAFARMDTAGPSSIAAPYVIYNGDLFYFQYGRVGGPTTAWFPSLLWNSSFDFLNTRI